MAYSLLTGATKDLVGLAYWSLLLTGNHELANISRFSCRRARAVGSGVMRLPCGALD
jgi:hypothetical protein